MSNNTHIFSSKPKQIAHAASQVLTRVFGNINEINLIVISDMKLPINIAENFKNFGIKDYNVLAEPIDKFMVKTSKGFFSFQSKFVCKNLVKKILKERKQKTIFFIDCGVPGNIDINISKISNCFLFDLNDLEQLYTSWIENMTNYESNNNDLYDIELKGLLDSFFNKMSFNLDQKMNFERRLIEMIKSNQYEIKLNLKNFLKKF